MPLARPSPGTLGLALALLILVLDQISKWAMMALLLDPPRALWLAPVANLVPVWNRGVSFGLLGTAAPWAPAALVAMSLAIVAGLLAWLLRTRCRPIGIALGLVIGGALGNVVDRLRFGAVFDFIDLNAFGYHWPAFNLADSAITGGVVLLLADAFLPSLFKGRDSSYDRG
ncbi:MAG: signal peptidase II [Proteobacteria bacterium]|nr:signal peptidase II [Pseudomonadota bacterium]